MNDAVIVFLVTVGATSVFIFALSRRMERRRAGWGSSSRGVVSHDAHNGLSASTDSFSPASWFGSSGTLTFHGTGHHDCCSAWDSGGCGSWEGGGGGDFGGGGAGGDSRN